MFNALIIRNWSNPYHLGIPPGEFVVGQEGFSGEGPYMKIALSLVDREVIGQAFFETYSCPGAVACGSWIAKWLEGKDLVHALKVTAEDIEHMLGGLPLGKEHCARLTYQALQSALHAAGHHKTCPPENHN